MAAILDSPKFVDRWARHYINLYKTKGADHAKKWALEFLNPEPRARMVVRVNELLKKKVN